MLQQRIDFVESLRDVPVEIASNHAMMKRSPRNSGSNSDIQSGSWWQKNGKVAVLRELPIRLNDGFVAVHKIGTLPPGTTVHAQELIELDSKTIFPKATEAETQNTQDCLAHCTNGTTTAAAAATKRLCPVGRAGIIQMIKVDTKEGKTGYACLSVDGYPLLAPGTPEAYVNSNIGSWIWRVTCPYGAFVRKGLDLQTAHTRTLPYGNLIRVQQRCINDQGLSRLLACGNAPRGPITNGTANNNNNNTPEWFQGFCSELLNPLSGQQGVVAQPLPFPVPAIYKVVLAGGAVIRKEVDLMSSQCGIAPVGSTVKVVARAFSEHPVEQCIERLKLAGNRGWISVKLNRPPPRDKSVVELVSVDPEFDPENPGLYHLNALREVRAERAKLLSNSNSKLDSRSSTDKKDGDDSKHGSSNEEKSICVVCLTSERNATIVHGDTGHIVCCLVCARVLKARGDKCPICRLEIERVIQNFYG